jgi:hypothetical protein
MTTPYRVLVTGSRDWTDETTLTKPLTSLLAATVFVGDTFVLVHGACPRGADAMANSWAEYHRDRGAPIEIERHRAEDFGPWPAAGPRRNAHMVSLGADACLAFIGPCTSPRCRRTDPHPSHGASSCADMAEAAGIPTRRWTA